MLQMLQILPPPSPTLRQATFVQSPPPKGLSGLLLAKNFLSVTACVLGSSSLTLLQGAALVTRLPLPTES